MGKRSFLVRSVCVASGVALIALGGLVVPASGIACLFLFDESASGNPYVDDDAVLGAFVFSATVALAYGVFAAPALWRRRPFQPEEPRPVPMADRWANPAFPYDMTPWSRAYDGAPGHFWEDRRVAAAPHARSAPVAPPAPSPDPVIVVTGQAEVNLGEIEAIERMEEASSPAHFVEESVPTLIGLPAATAVMADNDVCNDDDWFT